MERIRRKSCERILGSVGGLGEGTAQAMRADAKECGPRGEGARPCGRMQKFDGIAPGGIGACQDDDGDGGNGDYDDCGCVRLHVDARTSANVVLGLVFVTSHVFDTAFPPKGC